MEPTKVINKLKTFNCPCQPSLLQVICLPAGPNVQRLHSARCCAFSLSFYYPSSIIHHELLPRPSPSSLPFLSILPSIISLCRELPLRMCPIQLWRCQHGVD